MSNENSFLKMYQALKTIAKDYNTPQQLQRASRSEYGLDYEEALEMAYENIQSLAKEAIKGIRIKTANQTSQQH